MKSITVRTNFIGEALKEVRVNVDEEKSIKQLIDENYTELLPRPDLFDASMPDFIEDWESINEKSLRYFNSCYRFLTFQSMNANDIPIHLADRIFHIKSDNIKLAPLPQMIDDSVAFFIIEKYGLNEQGIIPIGNNLNPDTLRDSLERLLSGTDTQILIENFSDRQAKRNIGFFIEQLIPAELWLTLLKDKFSYYRNFIIHFAGKLMIIDYCVNHTTLVDTRILEDLSRGWINNFLYQMQNLMLVLLSIPEIYLRSMYNSPDKYSELLQKKRILKLPDRDEQYYSEHIKKQSISNIYFRIFGSLSISNYRDYIKFCEDTSLSDLNVGEIVNTYRILCNKLKHSSYVQIIKSRDEEKFQKEEIDDIDKDIEQIRNIQKIDKILAALTKQELELKEFLKDAKKKIRYAYAHLDFEDPEFKRNNGISVIDEKGYKFNITLSDMEVSLKVLVGILCILNRTRGYDCWNI